MLNHLSTLARSQIAREYASTAVTSPRPRNQSYSFSGPTTDFKHPMIKRSVALITVLLGLTFGWILGQKTSNYLHFFIMEPMLFPCPYTVDEITIACSYRSHEPAPDLVVWWHRWPVPEGKPSFPQSSGNWVRDILLFDPPPLQDRD